MTMTASGIYAGGTRTRVITTRMYAVGSILRPRDAMMTTSGDTVVSRLGC